MDQFIEQVSSWTENLDLKETDKWLEGDNNVDMERVSNEIKTGIQVELDCEKRTVEKIKKWGLEFVVSVNEYIQKANAYTYFIIG
jgi:formyltetrahydrofolate synthetase